MDENNNFKIEAFITNLGKYNEGELIGEWVEFPCSPETMNEVLERIGIGEEDEFGNPYEEYFISDYDGNMPSEMFHELGEYTSIEKLQIVGEILNRINELGRQAQETFKGLLEQYNYMDAAENLLNDRAIILEGVDDSYDLGKYIVDNNYGVAENIPEDKLQLYFDYEEFGRQSKMEYDATYEDTFEEHLGLPLNTDFEELGLAYEKKLGGFSEISNPEEYFNYEAFGEDIDTDSQIVFADGFAIDCAECENLGEDFYEEIKGDLIDEGILVDYSHDEPSYNDEER